MRLADYDYRFRPKSIALRPANPRDRAKLLVYERERKKISYSDFRSLGRFLPARAVLVFNNTKVLPARLRVFKPSGGGAQLLYLKHAAQQVTALADRRLAVGTWLVVTPKVRLKVIGHRGSQYTLRPNISMAHFLQLLQRRGTVPLPPYLRHSPLSEKERRQWYQTVFATQAGSVAAPTAALHFTQSLLRRLQGHGIALEFVTLHVNLGTFAPVTSAQIKSKTLHREQYEVSAAAAARLNMYKKTRRPIIAVGTTVARTLESATRRGRLVSGRHQTGLFIQPGYRWKFVDGLITNFHVPKSSLMMLVAALVGRETLLKLYRLALRRGFRFFSFGDGMLIR